MSVLTTIPVSMAPSAAIGLAVTSGVGAWTYGAWVQFSAGVSSVAWLAGVSLYGGTWAGVPFDIDVGIGLPGAEVSLGSPIRIEGNNSGGGGLSTYMLPAPVSGIPSGAAVSIRMRDSSGSNAYSVVLLYYLGLDSDHQTAYPFQALPTAATHVTVTPSGVAWTNSAWVQLTASQTDDTYVAGLGFFPGIGGVDCEFDIGTGGAGAEVVQQTLRSGFGGQNDRITFTGMPALFKIAAGTRIAVRLRISSTSVTTWRAALLFYDGTPTVTPPTPAADYPCNVTTPVFWGAVSAAGSVFQFAKQPLRDPSTYYGGFKPPRLLSVNPLQWTASDFQTGALPAQTAGARIADLDRYYRGQTRPSFMNAQLYLYLESEATRLAQANPTLLFQGPIYEDPYSDHLTYSPQATDYLSASYNLFKKDKLIPQRTIGGDFTGAPTANIGLGVPIIGGSVSDESLGTPLGLVKLINVGNMVIGGTTYAAALVCGHACAGGVLNLYQNNALVTAYGTDFWAPGKASWSTVQPSGALYFDINGNRYTLVFIKNTAATNFQNGTWPVYANVRGMEPNADGTGTYLANLHDQIQYLFEQWLTQSYLGGSWLTPATFPFWPGTPGTTSPIFDATSITAAKTVAATYLGGGFVGGFVIGANGVRQSIRDVLQNINISGNLFTGLNDQCQLFVRMFSTSRSTLLGSNRTITDRRDILKDPAFSIARRPDWFFNDLAYQWAQNYRGDSSGEWGGAGGRGHAPSKVKYGVVPGTRTYALIRDQATADAVSLQQLNFAAPDPPTLVTWAQSLCGMGFPLLSGVPITHYNGTGAGGWSANAALILGRTLDPATCKVTFTGMDVQALVS